MTLTFFKYPSLVNHYAIGKEKRIIERLDDLWYSTEKIHGANASIVVTRDMQWEVAKRSGFIVPGDKQFNGLKPAITEQMLSGIKAIFSRFPEYDRLHVFGEYFGKGVQAMDYDIVAEGKQSFRIFYVLAHTQGDNDVAYTVFGMQELNWYFSPTDLVPGNKQEAPLRELLLEEPAETSLLGGASEGNVYQPFNRYYFDESAGTRFIAVKHKCKSFIEKKAAPKKVPSYGIEELNIREELGLYVTAQRLDNVLSHGDFELIPQNIGKIMLAVKEDAIAEYVKETERTLPDNIDFMKLINSYSRDIASLIKGKIATDSMAVVVGRGK